MAKITDKDKSTQAKKLLEANSNFKEAVSVFQKKWHISENDSAREKGLEKFPESKNYSLIGRKSLFSHHYIKKGTSAYKDLLGVLKQFNLREQYWTSDISYYLLYGKFNPHFSSFEPAETRPEVNIKTDPLTGESVVSIELGKNTTLEDIKLAYLGAREMLSESDNKTPKPRFGHKKNFDRDSDIFDMHLEGKTTADISHEIKDKYGQDLDFGNIKKVVSQMKKIRATQGGKLLTSGAKRRSLNDLL